MLFLGSSTKWKPKDLRESLSVSFETTMEERIKAVEVPKVQQNSIKNVNKTCFRINI
jgi:hypothetical protein